MFTRHMRVAAVALLALGLGGGATLANGAPSQDGDPSHLRFTSIDVPGATFTNAQGINSRGDIVGFFGNASGTHGYLLSGGTFVVIDYPGAIYTDARGINARGDIVGAYRIPGEPAVNTHGYVRSKDGEFSSVDFPGHTSFIPQRITSRGRIVGCRHDTDLMETMRGVWLNPRRPDDATETDAFASMSTGATADGEVVVGLYRERETLRGRGYLLYGDTFIPFDVPGSSFTAAWDVNPDGAVVGVYRDPAGFHGFVWEKLRFRAINYPGASATRAFGINARGTIVGAYTDAGGRTHGFVVAQKRHD